MKRTNSGGTDNNARTQKEAKPGNPVQELSAEQQAICAFVEGGQGNGIIIARAGCGKTSILIEAVKRISPAAKVS